VFRPAPALTPSSLTYGLMPRNGRSGAAKFVVTRPLRTLVHPLCPLSGPIAHPILRSAWLRTFNRHIAALEIISLTIEAVFLDYVDVTTGGLLSMASQRERSSPRVRLSDPSTLTETPSCARSTRDKSDTLSGLRSSLSESPVWPQIPTARAIRGLQSRSANEVHNGKTRSLEYR
jgi:hypothetical protein